MDKQQKQHLKKEQFLTELESTMGIVSQASKRCGIDRTTPYRWCREDETFRDSVDEIQNVVLDFAESKLYELVDEKHPTAIIFLLKTKGRNRGYIERHEMDIDGDLNLTVEFIDPDDS